MSTSQKHSEFVNGTMGDKKVSSVAGIGPTYGQRLTDAGCDKAYALFGQYLTSKKDEGAFTGWLKDTADVRAHHAKSTYNCLNEWSEQYM